MGNKYQGEQYCIHRLLSGFSRLLEVTGDFQEQGRMSVDGIVVFGVFLLVCLVSRGDQGLLGPREGERQWDCSIRRVLTGLSRLPEFTTEL